MKLFVLIRSFLQTAGELQVFVRVSKVVTLPRSRIFHGSLPYSIPYHRIGSVLACSSQNATSRRPPIARMCTCVFQIHNFTNSQPQLYPIHSLNKQLYQHPSSATIPSTDVRFITQGEYLGRVREQRRVESNDCCSKEDMDVSM